jgi:hypothetical protein
MSLTLSATNLKSFIKNSCFDFLTEEWNSLFPENLGELIIFLFQSFSVAKSIWCNCKRLHRVQFCIIVLVVIEYGVCIGS